MEGYRTFRWKATRSSAGGAACSVVEARQVPAGGAACSVVEARQVRRPSHWARVRAGPHPHPHLPRGSRRGGASGRRVAGGRWYRPPMHMHVQRLVCMCMGGGQGCGRPPSLTHPILTFSPPSPSLHPRPLSTLTFSSCAREAYPVVRLPLPSGPLSPSFHHKLEVWAGRMGGSGWAPCWCACAWCTWCTLVLPTMGHPRSCERPYTAADEGGHEDTEQEHVEAHARGSLARAIGQRPMHPTMEVHVCSCVLQRPSDSSRLSL